MGKLREIEDVPKRLYAIGDVHACREELEILLNYLENKEKIDGDDLIVFIGDYIDRGPDAKGVIDRLVAFQGKFPRTVFLRGNHEDMFLDFLGFEGRTGDSFVHNGGSTTLKSYGLSDDATKDDVLSVFPSGHLSFFLNLESYAIVGEYVFAHAGLDPLRDLRAQLNEDLFWIREPFLFNPHPFEKTVVFGHTPYQDVADGRPMKLGIDTGLVYGNMLTAIELLSERVFQIERNGKDIKTKTLTPI